MQELYNKALRCYQQNDYEGALQLLRQCEMSTQVNALQNECTNALRAQYKYLIDEAFKNGDTSSINEYANRYQTYIGKDNYITSVIESASKHLANNQDDDDDDTEPWYNQDIAGISLKNILIIVVGLVAIVGGIIYLTGNQNKIAQAPEIDTTSIDYEADEVAEATNSTDEFPVVLDKFKEVNKNASIIAVFTDSDRHKFYYVQKEEYWNKLYVYDLNSKTSMAYDMFNLSDPEGVNIASINNTRVEGNKLYIIGEEVRNGSGAAISTVVGYIDTYTEEWHYLVNCAQAEFLDSGIRISERRPINEDTADCDMAIEYEDSYRVLSY